MANIGWLFVGRVAGFTSGRIASASGKGPRDYDVAGLADDRIAGHLSSSLGATQAG